MSRKTFKMSDQTIGQIAKCVQVAILTGTDVVDHLRQVVFDIDDTTINVAEEYLSVFNANIENMLQEAVEKAEAQQESAQRSLFS